MHTIHITGNDNIVPEDSMKSDQLSTDCPVFFTTAFAPDLSLEEVAGEQAPDSLDDHLDSKFFIKRFINQLTPREERVIRLRFGLDDVGVHSLGEVATEIGVTPERIRQIERKSLRKLRWHARRCFPENTIRYHALITNRNGTLAATSTKTPRVKQQQRRRPLDHMNGYRGGNPGYGQPSGASVPPYAATTSVKQYESGNSQPGPIASREDFDWRLFSHELIPSLAGIFLLSIAITGRGTVLLSMLMGAPLVIPVKITAFLLAMASTPWILKVIYTAYDWRTYRHQWRDNCDVIAKYSYLAWGFALITGLCASLWLQTIGSEGAQLFTEIFGNGSGLQIRAFVYAGTMLAGSISVVMCQCYGFDYHVPVFAFSRPRT